MWTYQTLIALWLVWTAMAAAVPAAEPPDSPVYFPDPNLKLTVEAELKLENPLPADMASIDALCVNWNSMLGNLPSPMSEHGSISAWEQAHKNRRPINLTGLEYATNLERLYMDYPVGNMQPLAKLEKLHYLSITCNEISTGNFGPLDCEKLTPLKNLQTLVLEGVPVANINQLSSLPNLRSLYLYRCPLTGDDARQLSQLHLTKLWLEENGLQDFGFLAECEQLEELSICNNKANDQNNTLSGWAHIAACRSLKKLTIMGMDLDRIDDIDCLNEVSVLRLSRNNLTDITPLTRLKKLQLLELYINPLSPEVYQQQLPLIIQNNPGIIIGCFSRNPAYWPLTIGRILVCAVLIAAIVAIFWLGKKKKRRWQVGLALVVIISLVPLPVRKVDVETAIEESIDALIYDKPVIILNKRYGPLFESFFYNQYKPIVYHNEAVTSQKVFEKKNLLPYTPEIDKISDIEFFQRYFSIHFSYLNSVDGNRTRLLQFSYCHGLLAGYGYSVIIYRNLWGVHVFYQHAWVS